MGKQVAYDPARENIHPLFHALLDSDKRYFLFTGGRGGMKSFNTTTWASMLTYGNYHRVLFTRYTMTAAEISIIPEFTEKLELLGVDDHFEIKRREIANVHTGSDIIFRGIKASGKTQTAKLKSIQGVTTWINDESEELVDESVFDTIDFSIRSNKRKNRIVLVMNPSDKNHWVYKRWIEGTHKTVVVDGVPIPISTHPDVCHVHTTYLDNEHLSESFVSNAQRLKQSNPDKYRYVMLGDWRPQAEGTIFNNWKMGEFDESLPYCYGMDYGFFPDPQAVGKVAVDKKRKKIYVKEGLYATELSDEAIVEALTRIVANKNDLIVADTSEPRTTKKIKGHGFNIRPAKKGAGSILEGIRTMQDYEIIVAPNSPNYVRELNNYAWNDRRASIPIDAFNHLLDLTRYAVMALVGKPRRGGKMTRL